VLVDISGQVYVQRENVDSNQLTISNTDMPSGIYILKVILDNDELFHSKILKIE